MRDVIYQQPNQDQVDCFYRGQWCALLQRVREDAWDLSVMEINGQRLDLSSGALLSDGTYFFSGSLQEAKAAVISQIEAVSPTISRHTAPHTTGG